ncbi:erythrocyte membrane protein 1, PfEMP1, putative [Plasmodium reichenowi]|uniref:Erythrocyte membrane protein 1, PfEMP1, putative n=1 Tax=Plasmodium reichenowi TaxID=5854 RepID=A0A2P9DSG3_PLARE|nr:erythrocyte membrane protein 1, PfEMP1, putative [Plasmodium reichenowi]
MGPAAAATPKYYQASSVKELFDMIGQTVHKLVEKEAKKYVSELHGKLPNATYPKDKNPTGSTENDPCKLDHTKHTNVTTGWDKEFPCGKEKVERFSEVHGGECDRRKVEGNKGREGACAPFRRLKLCHTNLEHIDPQKITTHNLLVDVCQAAKYEGSSISQNYGKYHTDSTGSPICTVLARSFADIGDIIRGKDLYLGDKEEKDRLQKKLKQYFGKIHANVTNNNEVLKARYGSDGDNYYKLREDWWVHNRERIWYALTCEAPKEAKYTEVNADGSITLSARGQCRSVAHVPTNFDYVPQYLRWLHEWAEDFCRKKKKYVDMVKTNCGGKNNRGEPIYCDRDGFDCTRTIRKIGNYARGEDCPKCPFGCRFYEKWIDNQKDEFLKQKKKYTNTISKTLRKKRDTTGNYHGYEKHFHDEINENYNNVTDFFKLLNNETECTKLKDDEENKVDFTNIDDDKGNNKKGTFYHSKYCEPCPLCGVDCKGGECTPRGSEAPECSEKKKEYIVPKGTNDTEINVLYSGKKGHDIIKKLGEFCNPNGKRNSQDEQWQCYYKNSVENMCKMTNTGKNEEEHDKIMTFVDFFNYWVVHLLGDIIDWRETIKTCMNKGNGKRCIKRCKGKCDCFQKWVEKKKAEWQKVLELYDKQDQNDFPYMTLEMNLENDYLPIIKDAYKGQDSVKQYIQEMENIIKGNSMNQHVSKENNSINTFIQQEDEEAKECLKTHTSDECPPQESPARSLPGEEEGTPRAASEDEDEEDGYSSDEEEETKEDQATEEVVEEVVEKEDIPPLDVCQIVANIFSSTDNLKPACEQKYGKPNRYWGWRCVPSGNGSSNTGSQSSTTGSEGGKAKNRHRRSVEKSVTTTENGAICIPPRRRRLYIGKIKEWAETQGKGEDGKVVSGTESSVSGSHVTVNGQEEGTSGGKDVASSESTSSTISSTQAKTPSRPTNVDPLLAAFVESAAVETFFLWYQYKQLNTKTTQGGEALGGYSAGYDGYHAGGGLFSTFKNNNNNMRATNVVHGAAMPGGMTPGMPNEPSWTSTGVTLSEQSVLNGRAEQLRSQLLTQPGSQLQPPPGPSVGLNGRSTSPLQLLDGTSSLSDSDPSDPNNSPEQQLASGVIPPDFLRQMFYTLGDYRDILVGNTPEGIDEVIVSGNKDKEGEEKNKMTMQQLSEIIKKTLEKQNSDTNPGSHSRTPGSPGVKSPSTSDKTPSSWWEENGPHIWKSMVCALTYTESGQMSTEGGTTLQRNEAEYTELMNKLEKNGKENGEYHYENVKLEQNSDTKAISNDNPTLEQFTSRPTYFRYLHEWGTEFCVKRAQMLKDVKDNCTKDGKKCSCYGELCEDNLLQPYTTFPDFNCPSCSKPCGLYKRWIGRKRTEYDKQKKIYKEQKENCQTESKGAEGNNGFCGKLGEDAEAFLQKLGACKKDSESGNNKTIFEDTEKTFGHENYCDPCSEFKINCKKNNCDTTKGGDCNGKNSITASDIKGSTEEIVMRVSYDSKSGSGFDDDLKEACQNAHIFNGIRKDVWTCGNVCGYVVCKPKNGNGAINGKNQIIIIRALFKIWLEYFLQDYNRIKHKISHCKENGKGDKCICGCNDKYKCVNEWITKKRTEWDKIKKHYEEHKPKDGDNDIKTLVTNFLEDLQSQIPVTIKKAIKPCGSLTDFKKSCGLDGTEGSIQKQGAKKKDINDLVECLLHKLQQKAEKCQSKHSGSEQSCGDNPSPSDENPTHVGDVDDDPLEEEDPENTVEAPKICPTPTKEEVKGEEEKCEKAPRTPKEPSSSEDSKPKEDQTNTDQAQLPKEEKVPAPAPAVVDKKKAKPQPQPIPPKVDNPSFQTALMSPTLMWSIGISFAALTYWFLKKKTKSSVDMLRVLQIPQNDYGIPTFKSKNRYVPYRSAQYRGKRYIYLEGDSGTDSGYTDYYSDITSSSESEYEEFDINDIYVPHAPKYKTLIEVVLEPSGKNTSTSDNTISNSDNTIPTSDKPNTPTSDIPTKTSDTPNTLSDTPNTPSDTPSPITDEEWNELKQNFISNMLQSEQKDMPNILDDNSDNNTHPTPSRHNVDNNTHLTPSRHNVDNNTHLTPSRHTLDQKPFIMSIHDRNLLSGEEYNYDMENSGETNIYSSISPTSGENNLYNGVDSTSGNRGSYSDNRGPYSDNRGSYSGTKGPISDNRDPYSDNRGSYSDNRGSYSDKNGPYSGIDLINDLLNSGNHDIYDEILKRKENELFGTNHVKHTSNNSVAKLTNSDPIMNQLELFHKWLDRHRDMCEKWDKNNKKEELLDKLKEEWNKDYNSDIPSSNKMLNADVSIEIDMDKPNQVDDTYVDSNPNRVDDNIYLDTYPDKYTVGNINPNLVENQNPNLVENQNPNLVGNQNPNLVGNSTNPVDENPTNNPNHVQIQMSVKNGTMAKENFPIGDVWDI